MIFNIHINQRNIYGMIAYGAPSRDGGKRILYEKNLFPNRPVVSQSQTTSIIFLKLTVFFNQSESAHLFTLHVQKHETASAGPFSFNFGPKMHQAHQISHWSIRQYQTGSFTTFSLSETSTPHQPACSWSPHNTRIYHTNSSIQYSQKFIPIVFIYPIASIIPSKL